MSHEIGIAWKIKVKHDDTEVEVIGMNPARVEKTFKELEEKYLKRYLKS